MFGHKKQNITPDDFNPDTPYHRAMQEYDERCGTAKANAANWRLIAFGLLIMCFACIGASYYFANRSVLTPYIVEVDNKTGAVISTSKIETRTVANQKEKEYFAWQVIKKARTLPKDIVVYESNWSDVYTFLDNSSSQKFNDMAIREDHKGKLMLGITTMLNLKQITQLSNNEDTYNIRWNEITYEPDGKKSSEYALEAFITIQQQSPSEKTMYINPLGLKIKDYSMSKVQQ